MPRDVDRDRRSATEQPFSIKQSLYGKLTTPEAMEDSKREEEKKKDKGKFFGHKNFYFWICDFAEKHFVKKAVKEYDMPKAVEEPETGKKKKKKKEPKKLPKHYKEALDFLGWKIDHRAVMAAPMAAAVIGLIIGLLLGGVLYLFLSTPPKLTIKCGDGFCDEAYGEDDLTCPDDCEPGEVWTAQPEPVSLGIFLYIIIGVLVFSLTFGMLAYASKYLLRAAETEKMQALTYVPEIINYMIMQMRLQPNLERAVDFAAEHGEGRIAEEFKELLWKNRVGIYETIEEGLDEMAYRWEPYSEEFKHAITLLRASVLLPNDAERNRLYDSALQDLLTSTKEKMELYTRSMKQPSLYLFYIAILLPLMIIIMLPVAGAFAKMPTLASVPTLAALYIFTLPLVTYLYARSVLSRRPSGYVPPEIPDDYPGLPARGTAKIGGANIPIVPVCIMLLIGILFLGYFLEEGLKYTAEDKAKEKEISGKELEDPVLKQYYIPLAFASTLGFYLYGKSINKRQAQQKIVRMELDFKDAMYLVASRLGEKKPLEDALTYVKRFMPESKVATELLENVQRNIMVLGLTLRAAIFDPVYGAMRYIPSRLMNSAFKIMTDSIELGPEVASSSMMSVSEQIRNVQKINELMRRLLDEVTSMMSSMATFVGPVILGMVSSLQGVIIKVVPGATGGTNAVSGNSALSQASSMMGGDLLKGGSLEGMASPLEFQTIIAIYVMLLVIILSYFTGKVKYGNNKVAIMADMGKTLPVSIAVFSASLFMGQTLMSGL